MRNVVGALPRFLVSVCFIHILFLSLPTLAQTWSGDQAIEKEDTQQEILTETGNTELTILDDSEFVAAVQWMHDTGMTKFDQASQFQWENLVTREQAAKFYSQFAKEVLFSTMDMAKYCRFGDLATADPSLKNYILEACLFSLFQGSSWIFAPKEVMTKDQAIAVLMRALLWEFLDESWEIRWREYYKAAFDAGITKETDMEKFAQPVSRYELALLLYRAAKRLESEKNQE